MHDGNNGKTRFELNQAAVNWGLSKLLCFFKSNKVGVIFCFSKQLDHLISGPNG
jgi:hypothetical protein